MVQRIDIMRRAGRNIRQAKMRTILTSLAISVGAFTIAVAVAAGNGGRAYINDMVSGAGDIRSIMVSMRQETPSEQANDRPLKVGEERKEAEAQSLRQADIDRLKGLEGVESVFPIAQTQAFSVSRAGGDQYVARVKVQYDGTAIDLTAGKLASNSSIEKGQVVLAHDYLGPLGFSSAEDALGKTIQIHFLKDMSASVVGDTPPETFTETFTVVAVDADPSSPLSFYNKEFLISNSDGTRIAQLQTPVGAPIEYYSAMVIAKDAAKVDTVKAAIVAAGNYDAYTFAEMRTSIIQAVSVAQYGLMGFGALALIAAVFGIINTQYIAVLERTREIGLMKALGMSGGAVAKLFRYEAAWIGFLGGVIGVGLAGVLSLFNPAITEVLKLEKGTQLLQPDLLSTALIVLGLMVIAILSGYFPARKAAKLDPIEALREE